jgi:S-adenosylmethionine hydrolase
MTKRTELLLKPIFRTSALAVLLLFSDAYSTAQQSQPRPRIVFMTDFGHLDDSVAICKGVMISVYPGAQIVDLLHDVTPFSIADGARFLAGTAPYYPAGTVFVVVIDPGVGSKRKAIVAKSRKGQYFVLPDNGLLTPIQDRDGIDEVREIQNSKWMIGARLSSTFHGRDIFSPVAAHLAKGDNISDVGPKLNPADLVRLQIPQATMDGTQLKGEVFATDGPYGNIITNITREQFEKLGYQIGDTVPFQLGDRKLAIPFAKTFSDVPIDKPLFYIDSRGRLGLAINQGDFAKVYNATPPLPIIIPTKK